MWCSVAAGEFDRPGEPVVRVLRAVVVMSVTERIVLRRVAEGRIARFQGSYYDHGRPVPDYLPAVVRSLLERELAVLAGADGDQWRRVTLTPAGQAYHEALDGERRRRHGAAGEVRS